METRRCLNCMGIADAPVCPHCGSTADVRNEAHQLPAGTLLRGQYLIGRALGQGGFGITYLGWDVALDRIVAVKEFYPNTLVNRNASLSLTVNVNTAGMEPHYGASQERFLREAKALAKLSNVPEIVGIHSCFQENNTAYIVMEFVRGVDLATYVSRRGGRLGVEETIRILEPVIRALGTVHKAGLVHRDISPDNIMLHPMGGAKLLDFGAVRAIENPDADQDLSRSTEAILKPGFAPMEQYRARGNVGPWSDEYALCGTIWYCLTGRVPPDAVSRSMGEEEADWDSIPGLAPHQKAALKKGMSFLAKDRYPSMEELYAALTAQVPAPPVPVPPVPAPTPKPVAQPVPEPQKEAPRKETPPVKRPAPVPAAPSRPEPVQEVQEPDLPSDMWAVVLRFAALLIAGVLVFILAGSGSGVSKWEKLILRLDLIPIAVGAIAGIYAQVTRNAASDLISLGGAVVAVGVQLVVLFLWGAEVGPGALLILSALFVTISAVRTVKNYTY